MFYRFLNMRLCYLQLIKEKSSKNKQTDKINNIFYKMLEGVTEFILSSPQKTGRASEDPNLPIDNRRNLNYPTNGRNTNEQL